MKVALVHDWLTTFGGAEQVLLELHRMFPEAPIYTSVYDPVRCAAFKDADVRTSYLQRLPGAAKRHQVLIPLMPQAFESFDLKEYDVVISDSTGVAKGVITQPHQLHVAYIHTPPRYLWNLGGDSRNKGRLDSGLRAYMEHKMRVWDVVSSRRPDIMLANSQTVADRIAKIYRRTAEVVYPPVDTGRFSIGTPGDYYLSVSRLIHYKRVDVIIEGCKKAGVKLKVAGDGPERSRLEKLAEGGHIEFLGRVSDAELPALYAGAKAFIFAAEEDFGIVPVEAMSAGRPVIAYGKGGLTESVKEGVSGTFFKEQSADSLAAALKEFKVSDYEPERVRAQAELFDAAAFRNSIRRIIERA